VALFVMGGSAAPVGAVVSSASKRPFLLNTIEFRGVPVGGWYEFPDKVAEARDLFARCAKSLARCPRRDVAALLADTAKLSGRDPHQILTAVNRLVNRHPYRSDPANFGKREYWASPLEFLAKSGDCEDYAIFKYALLRYLGLPADSLRVVLLKRKADGLGHAVLAVYLDDKVYILDSASASVRPQSEVTNYTAVFSFNENTRWAHVSTVSAKTALASASPADRYRNQAHGGAGLGTSRPTEPADSDPFLQLYIAAFSSAAPGPDEYRVQIGAFRSLENANELWQRTWRSQWDLLGRSEPWIYSLDLGARGRLHLLQIGALSSERQAESLCRALAERGVDCFVVKPRGQAAVMGET
jgi:predicted transglutaminase-like cysteine proteinase